MKRILWRFIVPRRLRLWVAARWYGLYGKSVTMMGQTRHVIGYDPIAVSMIMDKPWEPFDSGARFIIGGKHVGVDAGGRHRSNGDDPGALHPTT